MMEDHSIVSFLTAARKDIHTKPEETLQLVEKHLKEMPANPRSNAYLELQTLKGIGKLKLRQMAEGMNILEKVMPLLEVHHLLDLLAMSHNEIANSYWMNNDIRSMLNHCLKIDEIVARMGDESLNPSRYQNIGFAYMELGDLKKAQAYYERSIVLNRKLGNHEVLIQTYNKMATGLVKQELYKRALEYYMLAWRMSIEYKVEKVKGRIILNIGNCYRNLQEYDKAFEYYSKGQDELEKLGDKQMLAVLFINLGVVYHKTNDLANALKSYFKALKLYTELNMFWQRGTLYNNIANIYFGLNQVKKAMKYYMKALESIHKEENPQLYALLNINIGSCERISGNYSTAEEYIKRGIDILKEHNLKTHLGEAYRNLSYNSAERGDFEDAYGYLLECVRYYERVYDFTSHEDISNIKKRYDILNTQYENLQERCELLNADLQQQVGHQLIGKSQQIRDVHDMAMRAAMHPDVNVIIYGESGVGKEIISRIIHHASVRKDAYFCAINSSAISENLFESEFFGHVKGAFTSADCDKRGFIQQANRGTLFLDEITEMPLDFQAKLLRAIEEKKIIRVGDSTPIDVDFRVIASTNRDIHQVVEDDQFRYDLLHRLNTIEIYIPPLRERPEDIIVLMWHYIDLIGKKLNREPSNITEGFIEKFRSYSFPGNVRELRNLIERAIILADDRILNESIARKILPVKEVKNNLASIEVRQNLNLDENERELVKTALDRSKWNQKKAAELLGISQNAIFRKMKKYDLK